MPTEVHRLIYVSRWADGLEPDLDQTIRTIVASSIQNNRRNDVSGMLLAHKGWFIQALEGPRPRLCNLMQRISADPRHCDVHVLSAGAAPARAFGDWNMTAASAGEASHPFLAELGMGGEFDARQLDGPSAFRLMLALAEVERALQLSTLGLSAA